MSNYACIRQRNTQNIHKHSNVFFEKWWSALIVRICHAAQMTLLTKQKSIETTKPNANEFKQNATAQFMQCNVNSIIPHLSISEIFSRTKVAVISFPRYCRYRATLKRLEGVGDEWLRRTLVQALCGFVSYGPDTRVMFCKVFTTAFHNMHINSKQEDIHSLTMPHSFCRKHLIIRSWRRMSFCATIWRQNWKADHAAAGRRYDPIRRRLEFGVIQLDLTHAIRRYQLVRWKRCTPSTRRFMSNQSSNKVNRCWPPDQSSDTIRGRRVQRPNQSRWTAFVDAVTAIAAIRMKVIPIPTPQTKTTTTTNRRRNRNLYKSWLVSMRRKTHKSPKSFGWDWSASICCLFIRRWRKWAAMKWSPSAKCGNTCSVSTAATIPYRAENTSAHCCRSNGTKCENKWQLMPVISSGWPTAVADSPRPRFAKFSGKLSWRRAERTRTKIYTSKCRLDRYRSPSLLATRNQPLLSYKYSSHTPPSRFIKRPSIRSHRCVAVPHIIQFR